MLLLKWLLNALVIIIAAFLVPGVEVAGLWTALWLAGIFSLINLTLKPLLIILTLPINIITLGLFTFIINALLILFASSLLKGFAVSGFWSVLLFSLVLAVFNYLTGKLTQKDPQG